jgi:phage shock protein E
VSYISQYLRRLRGATSLLFLAALLASGMAQADDKDPVEAWTKIHAGAMVVDVRTAEEFAEGHLDAAVNIPFEGIVAEFAKLGIAKETPVVVYCRSGRRSGIAKDSLTAEGYNRVYNGGGYESLHAVATKEQADSKDQP